MRALRVKSAIVSCVICRAVWRYRGHFRRARLTAKAWRFTSKSPSCCKNAKRMSNDERQTKSIASKGPRANGESAGWRASRRSTPSRKLRAGEPMHAPAKFSKQCCRHALRRIAFSAARQTAYHHPLSCNGDDNNAKAKEAYLMLV